MAQVFMRFPGGTMRALTFSYDDGVEQDVKLIEIFQKYGLRATFNLNSGLYAPEGTVYPKEQIHRRMPASEASKLYAQDGIEVAVHGATHPWLDHMPMNMCTKDLLDDREALEKQFGTIVRGMAYPYGTYNDNVVDSMRSVGIVYSRGVSSSHDFDMPSDWMRLRATCHHNDPELMSLAKRFVEGDTYGRPRMFYLWGHSYEFEANNNWNVIEEFAEYVSGREEIWYATNIEIYDYQDAFNRLLFGMDGSIVSNPTAYKLWFNLNGKEYSIEPGEVLHIQSNQ